MVTQADCHWIFCLLLAWYCAQYGTQCGRHAGSRRKQKLKRSSGTIALTSDAGAVNPIGSTTKRETRSPLNVPQAE